VIGVDTASGTVTVGSADDLLSPSVRLVERTWVDGEPRGSVLVQTSAHGTPVAGTWDGEAVRFAEPVRRVAPGQSVALYDGDVLLGGGVAA
jgi:tRNA-specific 2-thiouridylase